MVGQDDLLLDEMHPGHDLDYNTPARKLRRCDAYTVSAVIHANTIISAWSQGLVMKGVKVYQGPGPCMLRFPGTAKYPSGVSFQCSDWTNSGATKPNPHPCRPACRVGSLG